MQILFALAAIGFGLCFAYGWACWFLPYQQRDWLTLALTTFGLSLGWLTLWMFYVALIWPGHLGLVPILSGCAVVGIIGIWLTRKDLKPASFPGRTFQAIWKSDAVQILLVGVILLACAGIVFNCVYWPFFDGDALEVYAPIAKEIYQTGVLPIGQRLYEAYPALVSLAYAFTHWAFGSVNEYLARLVPGLMAVGAVGAAGALGRDMRSRRAGIFAAGLIMLAPFFCKWASSGYVDIPGSFYFCLSALFFWRWWRDGGGRNAALTGIIAGLAMWTKNDALTLLVSLGLLVVLRAWLSRQKAADNGLLPFKWRETALLFAAILVVSGPWYIRNLVVFQFLIPPTVWSAAVQHTLGRFLAMALDWKDISAIGLLFGVSIFYAAVRLLRKGGFRTRSAWLLLLLVTVPFYAAWWWLASYDIRFLIMIVPPLAVMAGLMLDDIVLLAHARLSPAGTLRGQWLAVLCILALSPFSLTKTVEYKGSILSRPLMGIVEKYHIRFGGMYDLAMAVNGLPSGSRIVGVPAGARYYIDLTRLDQVSEVKVNVPPGVLAGQYDFAAYQFADGAVPEWAQAGAPLLRTKDGYFLFAVPK
jgi:hypothetical protein